MVDRIKTEEKIIQIIPESREVYILYYEKGKLERSPLICWALRKTTKIDEFTHKKEIYEDVIPVELIWDFDISPILNNPFEINSFVGLSINGKDILNEEKLKELKEDESK